MSDEKIDHVVKLLLVGDDAVGKTCLLRRFAQDTFRDTYEATIGMDMAHRMIMVDDKKIKLQIVDKATANEFVTVTYTHYRGVHGIMIVFDLTNQDTFSTVSEWLEEVISVTPKTTRSMVVGTKCDLEEERVVQYTTAKEFADEKEIEYMETSAKNSTNVEETFIKLIKDIIKNKKPDNIVQRKPENKHKDDEIIQSKPEKQKKSSSTCSVL